MMSPSSYQKPTSQQIVTFLFSDIEHSTRLAQQLREGYPDLLKRYRGIIREEIAKFGGKEIDTAGDGFFISFDNPRGAVLAAAEMQQAFHTQQWATEIGLKVRIGIHTGIALSTDTGGYTGVEVHCASRICDAANGGQVLISYSTQQFLRDDLANGLSLSDLGGFVFKDFVYPIDLFQLNIPGLPGQFPEPRINPKVFSYEMVI